MKDRLSFSSKIKLFFVDDLVVVASISGGERILFITEHVLSLHMTIEIPVFIFQDPNEDTEWNDVLRDFGIIPPKEEEKDEVEEMVLRLQEEAAIKPYERMTLGSLKEAEDIFQDDERAIEIYRQQRIQELKSQQKRQMFGELVEIPGTLYVKEVTNAKPDVWVVIHLYRSCIPMCVLLNQHLQILAEKFPETKFLKAIVDSCIHKYQDHCLPTLLVYRNGQVEDEFIGAKQCGGTDLRLEDLEWKLNEAGAVKSDLEEDPKKKIVDLMMSSVKKSSIHWKDSNTEVSDNTMII
ncbi:LOW QUALITY PROTEIN: phosducin-like protein 2 [Pelodytes ibericus]